MELLTPCIKYIKEENLQSLAMFNNGTQTETDSDDEYQELLEHLIVLEMKIKYLKDVISSRCKTNDALLLSLFGPNCR
jgi:hypothetical protein